ncbi:polysaccharide deacetylase family protein [Desulfatitalea alkaliphila]|uniref:Polysaccharide deacetylase family protein n=1 Tax=Desulfatitalea alkaliphila TaxID=2929485 RepID=A0AA41R5B4_9BACT|nr:polysaccharide deacetylase family protein [Desulfatitalea alkaliphila]MCJ8502102.1 polysaccharide deacetylase family protein [Desulfatitalea alkaliphila]
MQITFLIDDSSFKKEVEYVARVFSSVLAADIQVQDFQTPLEADAVALGYFSPENIKNLAVPEECRIWIIADSLFWKKYTQGKRAKTIKRRFGDCPIIQSPDKATPDAGNYKGLMIDQDIILSSFWLLSRYEECFEIEDRDQHDRYKFSNSVLAEDLGKSLIHLYLQQLVLWIKEQYKVTIPFRSANLEAVISHDIDIPYHFGKIRSVLSAAKARLTSQGMGSSAAHLLRYMKVRAGMGKDRNETFDYIMQTQAQRGIKSTWFILLCSDNLWGLDLDKYAKQLQSIAAAGHEIGLHPGYDSYINTEKRTTEKIAIEQMADCTIIGARNHFLRFKIPESYHIVHETGLIYDSTLGFAEREGFRAGFCSPFKPFDPQRRQTIDMLEIPMSIMDGTFRDYQHLPPPQAEVRIKAMIDHVADIRGSIVFNWHNTFLLAEEPAWRQVYENSLDYLIEKNASFSTADELARTWGGRWQ